MRVSEDYAGKTTSAKWLATTLRNYNKPNLVATIESVRKHQFDAKSLPSTSCPSSVRWMPLAKDECIRSCQRLGRRRKRLARKQGGSVHHLWSDAQWDGPYHANAWCPHRAAGSFECCAARPIRVKANGADNAYAAASQPANGQPPKQGSASASLDDEIPF